MSVPEFSLHQGIQSLSWEVINFTHLSIKIIILLERDLQGSMLQARVSEDIQGYLCTSSCRKATIAYGPDSKPNSHGNVHQLHSQSLGLKYLRAQLEEFIPLQQ